MASNNLKGELVKYLLENDLVKPGDVIRHSYSNSRLGNFYIDNRNDHDVCPTLGTRCDCLGIVVDCGDRLRIRKFTPRECWRLNGFDDSDFDKASQVCTDINLYIQTGNSIAVNCLEAIFANLLGIEQETKIDDDSEMRLF